MSLIEEALRRVQPGTETSQTEPWLADQAVADEERIRRVQVPVTNNRWIVWLWASLAISMLTMTLLTRLLHPISVVRSPGIAHPPSPVSEPSAPVTPPTPVRSSEPPPAPSSATEAFAGSEPVVVTPEPLAGSEPPAAPVFYPFFLHRPPVQPPELKLNGVVAGVGETFAIINGSIVRLGDSIAGATLVSVENDTARLRWQEQELQLRTQQ